MWEPSGILGKPGSKHGFLKELVCWFHSQNGGFLAVVVGVGFLFLFIV